MAEKKKQAEKEDKKEEKKPKRGPASDRNMDMRRYKKSKKEGK